MSSSLFLFNPGIPGFGKRPRVWKKPKGRPRGSKDKQKRKTPNREHLRKGYSETEVNEMDEMMKMEDESEAKDKMNDKKRKREDSDEEDDDQPRTEERDLHRIPDFHRQPCSILICGESGSGKTTAITGSLDPSKFHNVFLITNTKHTENLNHMVEDEAYILEGLSDEFINMLTEFHMKNKKAKSVLLFDDHVGMDYNFKQSKPYKKLCAAARNFRISILDSCQDIVEMPTIFRRNAHWYLFGSNTDLNNETIATQLAFPGLPKTQFLKVLRGIAKRGEHEWLVYDKNKKDWWIWKPDYVPGLSGPEDTDDDDDDDEDEEDADESETKIPRSKFSKTSDADKISTARAREDAEKARKN